MTYGDPAKIIERSESYHLREKYGCAVCTKRQTLWGQAGCRIEQKPGKRGFCPQWDLDIVAEPLRVVG